MQHPSFEWFLRQVYSGTSLKLVSFVELPAGFTYLGTSEELRGSELVRKAYLGM